jgi:hypothetical protein
VGKLRSLYYRTFVIKREGDWKCSNVEFICSRFENRDLRFAISPNKAINMAQEGLH